MDDSIILAPLLIEYAITPVLHPHTYQVFSEGSPLKEITDRRPKIAQIGPSHSASPWRIHRGNEIEQQYNEQ